MKTILAPEIYGLESVARHGSSARSRSRIVTSDHHLLVRRMTAAPRRCRTKSGQRSPNSKRNSFNFLENNPIQSSFECASCPKTRRNWLRLPIVRFSPGPVAPADALSEATPAAEGHCHFRAIHALVGIRSIFAVRSTHCNLSYLPIIFMRITGSRLGSRSPEFVLKYFLLPTADRKKRSWQRRALLADTQEQPDNRQALPEAFAVAPQAGRYASAALARPVAPKCAQQPTSRPPADPSARRPPQRLP